MNTTATRRARWAAHQDIDRVAGEARLRYITDVPGQQATYLIKAQQARQYLADTAAPVPPYVQAEADAMGVSPVAAAESIAELETLWSDVVGPGIERARRAGKIAVSAASGEDEAATLDLIEAARVAAVTEINGL
jgi:hypothetical protein